jgi:hypothetical protein
MYGPRPCQVATVHWNPALFDFRVHAKSGRAAFQGKLLCQIFRVIAMLVSEDLPGQFSYELVEDMRVVINILLSMLD